MNNKIYVAALLGILLVAIIFRFYDLSRPMVWVDEPIYIVSGIKLLLQNPNIYNPLIWNFEHPPLAKYLIGLFALTSSANFQPIIQLPPNYYAGLYNVDVTAAMNQALVNVRSSPALFGVLLVIVIYFLAKELYGNTSGLVAAFLAAVSVNLLTFSRTAHLDIYLYFFSTVTIYLFYKFLTAVESKFQLTHKRIVITLDKRLVYFLLTGVFLGLSLLTKTIQPFILFPAILVIYFFYRRNTSIVEVLALFAISLLVFFIGVGDINLYIQAIQYFGGGSVLNPTKIISGFNIIFRIEPVIMILFVIGLYFIFKNKPSGKDWFILIPIVLIALSFLLSSNQHYRYFVYALPFMIVIASKPLANKKILYFGIPLMLLLVYSAIAWFPDYIIYTNVLDQLNGRNYFWQIAGFVGLEQSAKYLEQRTSADDIIFSTKSALRYELPRNMLAHEGNKNTIYLLDGTISDLQQTSCPTEDALIASNFSYAVVQNPKILGADYCNEIKDLYNKNATQTITVQGMDAVKIFRLKQ